MDNQPKTPATPAPNPYQPMDPVKKRKIITISAITGGAFVLLLIGIAVLLNLLIVDYSEAYDLANTIRAELSNLYSSSDCENVSYYVDRPTVSETKYESYISACRESVKIDDDTIQLLGETEGVRRDPKVREQFEAFKDAYLAAFPGDHDFKKELDAYQSWHSFLYQKYKLTTSSSEDDYRAAAAYAKSTGYDALAQYGEEWLRLALAYRSAYHAYWDDSKAGDDQYRALTAARSALQTYVRDSEPDIEDEVPLEFSDLTKAYRAFEKLYDLIEDALFYGYDEFDYGQDQYWWTVDS